MSRGSGSSGPGRNSPPDPRPDPRLGAAWLDDPARRADRSGVTQAYPGERLGLPARGRGSVGGLGRRLGALFVDWIVALVVAGAISRHAAFDARHPMDPLWPIAVFAFEYVALVGLVGCTIGMRLFGIGVVRLGGRRLTLPWVVVRTVLLLFVIPAVVYDRDQRGLHDRAVGCVVIRL